MSLPQRSDGLGSRFRRVLVVANPIAGRGRARKAAEELVRGLRDVGTEAELQLTERRGHGAERAAEAAGSTDLIVAVGGDGTLGDVIDGLARTERGRAVPVALLPMGTANVLALDLGLPRDPAGLLRTIAAGRIARLDVASVNRRTSFLVTGVGFDGMILKSLDRARRGPITRWSYVRHGLRALRDYAPPRLRVTLDGVALERELGLVLASNIVHYGGFACLSADRRIDDGRFEVYLFREGSRRALLGYALRGLTVGLPGGSCERLLAKSVRVESDEPVPYQVDGDYGGETPVDLAVSDRPFELVVP